MTDGVAGTAADARHVKRVPMRPTEAEVPATTVAEPPKSDAAWRDTETPVYCAVHRAPSPDAPAGLITTTVGYRRIIRVPCRRCDHERATDLVEQNNGELARQVSCRNCGRIHHAELVPKATRDAGGREGR